MIMIILLALALVACIAFWIEEQPGFFCGLFITLLVEFLVFLLSALVCCGVGACWTPHYAEPQLVSTTAITALKDGTSVEGEFYYRRGYIDEKEVYTVLTKSDKGLRTIGYAADKTYICFDSANPRVEEYIYKDDSHCEFWTCMNNDKTEYLIYIPEDAVLTDEYNIDLED